MLIRVRYIQRDAVLPARVNTAPRLLRFKDGLFFDPSCQRIQRNLHHAFAPFQFVFGVLGRVSGRVRDPSRAHDPICADGGRNRCHRRNHNGGESFPFDFFDERCAATRARPSGSCNNDAFDALLLHPVRHRAPDFRARRNRHPAPYG